MSYKVGQYLGASATINASSFASNYGTVVAHSHAGFGIITANANLTAGTPYYVKAKIKQHNSSALTFDVRVQNSDKTKVQTATTVTIPNGTGWVDAEAIFTPYDSSMKQVQFALVSPTSASSVIVFEEFYIIKNMLGKISGGTITEWLKLGIQGTDGKQLFCVNREPFYIGGSGIREINNGVIPINFFCPILTRARSSNTANGTVAATGVNRNLSTYIVDYMYESGGN